MPLRRAENNVYREDDHASNAAELATFRATQLQVRAVELLSLWDDRLDPRDEETADRRRAQALERAAVWRDLLLFGEHTWGAQVSVSQAASRQTIAQWEYKRRFIDAG